MRRLAFVAALALALMLGAPARSDNFPKLDDGQVIMNWSDFEKILRELLKPPPEEEEEEESAPPVPYSLKQANFDLAIEEGYAVLKGRFAVSVLDEKEWVAFPAGLMESGVHGALVDGKPALLMNRDGVIYVLLKSAAAHEIEVEYAARAPHNPGPNFFVLPVAPVPGARIAVSAPENLSDIEIDDAVVTGREKKGGRQLIEAALGATDRIAVAYTVPAPEIELTEEEKARIEPRLYSAAEILVTIADEVTTVNARFVYDIKRATVSRLSMTVPEGCEVVNAAGQGVTTWKVEGGVLKVALNYEVEGEYALDVHLESKREKASGEVSIPVPASQGVERESGVVAIVTSESLEVELGSLEGLRPMDAVELPETLRGRAAYPVLYALGFASHPASGKIKVTRHREVPVLTATIDIINLVTLFTEDGKSVTRVIYEVRNNKQQYLKIDLPEEAEVWSAFLDDSPVKPAKNEQGQTLIPLKKSGSDGNKVSFTAEVIYYAPIANMDKKGALTTVFPKADIPASEMLVTLYLPPNYDYKDFEGDLEELKDEPALAPEPVAAPAEAGYEEPARDKSRLYSKRAIERQAQMELEIADELESLGGAEARPAAPTKPASYQAAAPRGQALGMLAVKFNVPLRGSTRRFTKLLVMDEAPELGFNYKKHREPGFYKKIWIGVAIGFAAVVLVFVVWAARKIRKPGLPRFTAGE